MTKDHAEKNVEKCIIRTRNEKKKHKPLSTKEVTSLCSASYELNNLTLQKEDTGGSQEKTIQAMGLHANSFCLTYCILSQYTKL